MDHQAINHLLQEKMGVTIQDLRLLEDALTHDSCGDVGRPFERLEFLGDACLEMVVADLLFAGTELSEGKMSPFRHSLTCKESLASILRSWKIEEHIRLGDSMDSTRLPDTIYADVLESLLGAVYRDQGFPALHSAVSRLFKDRIEEEKGRSTFANPKTRLQEWAMARRLELPKYSIIKRKGPSHLPEYELEVEVDGKGFRATAGSIKVAESEAAKRALGELESS
jgi:ribonuclease-3